MTPWGLLAGGQIDEHIGLGVFLLKLPYESFITLKNTSSSFLGTDLHYRSEMESGFHIGLKLGWLLSDDSSHGFVLGPSIGYDLSVAPNLKIGLEASSLRISSGGFINLLMGQVKYELK